MALLKTLIAVMSVLILAGIVAVVWRIAQMGGPELVPEHAVSLNLDADCSITGASTVDGMVTITVGQSAACNAVYIIDLASGEKIARIVGGEIEGHDEER